VDRPVSPRDRTAGWQASVIGVGTVVGIAGGVAAIGWLLAVLLQLMAP
jgi:hypothetical protein